MRLKDLNRLQEFRTRELKLGSMFLKTPVLRAVGEVVQLVVIHPVTDEEFVLTASVAATSQGSPTEPKGMSLKIAALDGEREAAFDAFVAGEVAPPEQQRTQVTENPLLKAEQARASPSRAPIPASLPSRPPPPPEEAPVRASASRPPPLPPRPSPPPDVDQDTATGETLPAGPDPHQSLRQAVEREPHALGPRVRLGAALARDRATAAEAVSLLRGVLESEPQHPLAHGSLALAHSQLGEATEAERHLTRALRLGHVDPELERRVRGG